MPDAPHRLQTTLDAQTLAGVDAACFVPRWRTRDYRRLLLNPGAWAWLLLDVTDPAAPMPFGMAFAVVVGAEAELYRIGIAPERRGRGWGRRLLEGMLAEGRRSGWRRLYLEVREDNAPALALYRSLGLVETGRRPGYYGNPPCDALLFEWRAETAIEAGGAATLR